MANTISAISAYTDSTMTATDMYKLYPYKVNNSLQSLSANQVLGTIYSFGIPGYDSYYVNFRDAAPGVEVSDSHAKIVATPAYVVNSNITFNGATGNNLKLFANCNARYQYTGSSTYSDYVSMAIICRYARFIHLSGNVAYDYRQDYTGANADEAAMKVWPIATLDLSTVLPTAFDSQVENSGIMQSQIMWLTEYIEENLDEATARQIITNPGTAGRRLNIPGELHSPIKVQIRKDIGSMILQFYQYDYPAFTGELPIKRRIGRLVFDVEIIV